jgi:hypothetical protein
MPRSAESSESLPRSPSSLQRHRRLRPTIVCARTPRDVGTEPELRTAGAAAQTRIVSVAGIRLDPNRSMRCFKGIVYVDISKFESYMPSHAVGLLVAFFFGAAIDAWLRIPLHHLHCFAEGGSAVEARRAKRNGCPKKQASISRECDVAHASPPGSSLSPA